MIVIIGYSFTRFSQISQHIFRTEIVLSTEPQAKNTLDFSLFTNLMSRTLGPISGSKHQMEMKNDLDLNSVFIKMHFPKRQKKKENKTSTQLLKTSYDLNEQTLCRLIYMTIRTDLNVPMI